MDSEQIKGKWEQLKGKVREKWGKLTDDDLDVINGRKEQLVGKLRERYGYAKEQAERELKSFMRDYDFESGESYEGDDLPRAHKSNQSHL